MWVTAEVGGEPYKPMLSPAAGAGTVGCLLVIPAFQY